MPSAIEVANKALNLSLENRVDTQVALQRIDDHEKTCLKNQEEIKEDQKEIKRDIEKLYTLHQKAFSTAIKVLVAIIGLLLSIAGTLIYEFIIKH